jgi:thioesterase domain-containing protein
MTTDAVRDLEAYLHVHIPLSAAMQVTVVAVSPEMVTLAAPLAPNINHRNTAFGGSVSAVAILSAWALMNRRLLAEDLPGRLVIQSNQMDYDAPISSDFTATATLADTESWPLFRRTLQRRGRGRIRTNAMVRCGDTVAGRFEGEFVAFLLDRAT